MLSKLRQDRLPRARPRCLLTLAAVIVLSSGGDLRAAITQPPEKHWAFQPVVRPAEPEVHNKAWVRNAIDRFVVARLERERLTPSPETDRATLIRRLSFDLVGLPPSPAEVEAFVTDQTPDAYGQLVERLLASSHFGERWGRHWLDAVGYADSNGYFDADTERPLAYRYRDYVVKSLNDDKPFDRFIQEQIAGDELAGYQPDGDVTPQMVEALTATHFFRNAPDGTGESDGNPLEQKVDRYSVLEGNVQILGSAFLGLTVQCARCHDHKFEPITQAEYYQLQAILRPAYNPESWIKPNDRLATIGSRAAREENKRQIEKFERELKAAKESLEGIVAPFRKVIAAENLDKLPEPVRAKINKALEAKEKERTEEMKALLKEHEALVHFTDEEVIKKYPELGAGYDALKESLKKRESERPVRLPQIAVLTEPVAEPPRHHILLRGNYAKEGDAVPPGVPAVLCSSNNTYQVSGLNPRPAASRARLPLARWLTSPENPIVARVLVNRIWQRHFGEGLVSTLDNFGVTGAKPTHPELLDHLAAQFIQSGWRVKDLHRLIVASAAYRQSSAFRDECYSLDPENKWLWRFHLQRLDAESLRDAMLSISGELDPAAGGPFIPADKSEEGQFIVNEKNPGSKRRSLYLQQRRTKPVTMLEIFDGAHSGLNCTRRSTATVPLQSLALLNSSFVRERSKRLAQEVIKQFGGDEPRAIQETFERCLGRGPKLGERRAAEEFLVTQAKQYSGNHEAKAAAWTDFCQMLLASNAFLYIE
jgi:hypothetical protein